ncbi:hypothetical protein PMm318_A48880 [Pseudomonas moorei]
MFKSPSIEYRWRPLSAERGSWPSENPQKPTITCVDIHHRHECLPPRHRQRRIDSNPTRNPVAEGRTMLIHLLTCLALTAFTLSVLGWFVLSEERTS